jgi:hypothetical protein
MRWAAVPFVDLSRGSAPAAVFFSLEPLMPEDILIRTLTPDAPKPFQVRSQGEYPRNGIWDNGKSFDAKLEAEREALRLVHEARCKRAIVVEMQPVVITQVVNDDGVRMTYPKQLMKEGYD